MIERPDFKLAIDDPTHFIGRRRLLDEVLDNPYKVRIFLGGKRIGKSSLLNAIHWSLLEQNTNRGNTFPVLINLDLEQPNSLDNLRYIMIAQLIKSIEEWRNLPGISIRESYRSYRRQLKEGTLSVKFPGLEASVKVDNPDRERQLIQDDFKRLFLEKISELEKDEFRGICFLLDGAQFITRQQLWAGDACSYFRGIKDFDRELKPFLGLIFSGYRELKEYQQKIGSKLLNIADIKWIGTLNNDDAIELINKRKADNLLQLNDQGILNIHDIAGGHPFLAHQVLDFVADCCGKGIFPTRQELVEEMLERHDDDFSAWWNEAQEAGGCSENEHRVYKALIEKRQGNITSLAQHTGLPSRYVKHALDVLSGTGIIKGISRGTYEIGAQVFEEWIVRQGL